MITEKKEWIYRCLMRPPCPGAVPRQGLDRCDYCDGTTPGGHYFWGTVVYTRPLSEDDVWQYDLEEVQK